MVTRLQRRARRMLERKRNERQAKLMLEASFQMSEALLAPEWTLHLENARQEHLAMLQDHTHASAGHGPGFGHAEKGESARRTSGDSTRPLAALTHHITLELKSVDALLTRSVAHEQSGSASRQPPPQA